MDIMSMQKPLLIIAACCAGVYVLGMLISLIANVFCKADTSRGYLFRFIKMLGLHGLPVPLLIGAIAAGDVKAVAICAGCAGFAALHFLIICGTLLIESLGESHEEEFEVEAEPVVEEETIE